jgi:hypothetical protein
MKWIGQHIWSFISRFRNDVYLEDVSSGTIASGGNLGLDSNNKIVKATVSGGGSGDITGVTLAGDSGSASDTSANVDLTIAGGNAITTSGSSTTITINHDDTSSQASVDNSGSTYIQDVTLDTYGHVTGLTSAAIPTLNQDTTGSAATLTTARNIAGVAFDGSADISLNNDAITNGAGYTTNTGDITSINITTDEGGGEARAIQTSGDADFSILGANGVGVTNSGGTTITVAAVPAEIDHDSLNNFASNEHFTQANITTVGTISTGVWQGTAIATDQQKHLAYFEFKGYGTGDGTNYEMIEEMTDANAPFEHNTSTGSDGLTAQTIQTVMRSGGVVMPHSGTLKKFTGWVTSAGSGTINVALFKFTPTDDSAGNLTPVRLVNEQTTASGNAIMNSFSETSSFDAGFTAGDIVYPAVLGINTKAFYYNSVLEVEWS